MTKAYCMLRSPSGKLVGDVARYQDRVAKGRLSGQYELYRQPNEFLSDLGISGLWSRAKNRGWKIVKVEVSEQSLDELRQKLEIARNALSYYAQAEQYVDTLRASKALARLGE